MYNDLIITYYDIILCAFNIGFVLFIHVVRNDDKKIRNNIIGKLFKLSFGD